MKRIALVAVAAFTLTGCGGGVIGSTPQSSIDPGAYAPPAVADDVESNGNSYTLPTYGLPIVYYSLTVKRDDKCALTVTMDKPVYARDQNPLYNFTLSYHHKSYTSDSLVVQEDDSGLLMGLNTTSENQSLAIVDQTFALAKQLAAAPLAVRLAARPSTAPLPCKAGTSVYAFNPLTDARQFSQQLETKQTAKISLSTPVILGSTEYSGTDQKSAAFFCPKTAPAGDRVYFRANRLYKMTVTDEINSDTQDIIFSAPDPTCTYSFPMVRRDLVKFDAQLTFDHGVLTKVQTNDPSEFLALIQIPGDIIKDVLGLDTSSSGSAAASSK